MPGPEVFQTVAFPRGVASPEGNRAFFENLPGFVEGIELEAGRRLWQSTIAGEPVLAARAFVVVVRGARAWRLDAETGRMLDEQVLPLELPPGLEPPDVEVAASLRGESLRIEWKIHGRYRGGAPAPDEIQRSFERRFSQIVEWDLTSGRTRAVDVGAPPAERDLPSWPYRQRGAWRERAWRCDEHLLRLVADASGTISLHRGQGAAEGPTGLSWKPPIEPTVTPDGCHLLVRPTTPPSGVWAVIDTRAAREVAGIPYPEGAQFPAILGDRLYFMTAPGPRSPAALHAVDLGSGNELWQMALAPPVARGVPPLPRSGPPASPAR